MSELYRQPGLLYRSGTTYDGTPVANPEIDITMQDSILMEVVDQYGKHKGWLNASALQSVTWTLNDSGSAQLNLTNLDPAAANLLVFGGGELKITFLNMIDWLTGEPVVWQGIPMRLQRQPGQSSLTLEGLFSYFKFRIVEYASLMYTAQDQFDIAWGLMETYQQYTNYDRNIHASFLPSGVTRSRYYPRDMHQKIYDVVQAFRSDNLQGGFDFLIEPNASGERLWIPGYPHLGRLYPGLLAWGKNIVDYNLQDDGSQMMTKCYTVGGGTGGVQLEQSYEDAVASKEYGALVGTFSDSSEQDLTWLLQVATHQVSMRNIPIPNYQITCAYDDNVPILGSIRPGDTTWVRIDDGVNQIDQTFRVQSIGWQNSPSPSVLIQFYQPNLQGYEDPMAEEVSLET